MHPNFPAAVPEMPVTDVAKAAEYYQNCFGFHWDWGKESIGQITRGASRIFLTDHAFRKSYAVVEGPAVIWLNLESKKEVDELHEEWSGRGARILSQPESKPWHLHEFLATDLDGNLLRVFYDFAWELPDRGGRKD